MLKLIENNIVDTDITKISSFKSWFGRSKVVDKSGKPLLVYHGSNSKFSAFDMSKIGSQTDTGIFGKGFYFSTVESTSKVYGEVRSFYLSIQNPFIIDKTKSVKDIADYLNLDEDMFTESNGIVKPLLNYISIFTSQVKDNHDGVIVDRGISMKEIVAFYPNQIKSATDNNGKFSKASTNIYESKLQEGRKLVKILVMYDVNTNCFSLNNNGENKTFIGDIESFRKFLSKYKAIDSTTKPKSLRQTTYKQMVQSIVDSSDRTILFWSNNWNKIPYRTLIKGD